jgi:hypothetical protein
MTLLTDTSVLPTSVGRNEEGGDRMQGGVAVLEIQVEWMRPCVVCGSEQRFVAGWICDAGLVGCCAVCGAESVARFTRVNSEVA